ncbi:MAG: C40 family peptidase [Acidimicrobiaceae bacterium]|nr:C40 family peptidase [Acidimicrobiaceae bacterium]
MKPKQSTSLKRKATLALLLVSTASLAQLVPAGGAANGETLQSARAQAAAIAARLNILGAQVSSLAEKYNQAQLSLANVNQQVNNAQNQISQTQAKIVSIKAQLSQEAINAYISGGNLPEFSALLSENPTEASVRVEYLNTVTNSQTDLIASYQDAAQSLQQQQLSLKALQAKAASAVDQVSSARNAAQTAVNQENAQLGSVNSTIAVLVAQQQQLLAQEAAARVAQETAASTRQVITGGSFGSPSGGSAPSLSGGQISIALSWARQELGKPYRFGASGPNAFDCSGLTAFVFAKAGISLPHSAAAQYSDTTRVSLSSLQPGDLVFYYSPISHVAIYIGGGQVLQALNESSPVEISGIYWDGVPVGAGRL